MGLAAKLVAVLSGSALLFLVGIGIMQYHAGTLSASQEVERTLNIMLDRLAISLCPSLDEFDIDTITETVRSEFALEELHTILIWDEDHTRLLKGFGRTREGIEEVFQAPDDPRLVMGERTMAVTRSTMQGLQEPLGSVEVYLSKAPVLGRLYERLAQNLLQQAILVALLIVILAFVSGRYVVRPLEKIRKTLSAPPKSIPPIPPAEPELEPDSQPGGDDNGEPDIPEPPVAHLNPKSLEPAFTEILELAGALQQMVDALENQRQALASKEEDLRITLNSIGDAVIATDPKGIIMQMNPVAEKLTGWSLADARGLALNMVFQVVERASRDPIRDPVGTVMTTGERVDIIKGSLLIARDGRECLIADSAAPIRGDSSEVVGVVLVFRDITEQTNLEEQLMRVHKLDALGQLAGGVAHDFNNMLTGIIGATEMLQISTQSDPQSARYVALIQDTAQKATDLTGKLLAIGRRGKRTTRPLDIHEALGEAIELLKRSIDRRIIIDLKLEAARTIVKGDASQLHNVFINLGVNARDAMPEGGHISFSTQNVNLGQTYCRVSPFSLEPGTYIQVTVRDTGSGMDQQVLAHLFEPFFTTKGADKGTGLGLSAVYSAMQDHQGSIHVYSEPDRGTVFHLYFPTRSESLPDRKSHPREPVPGKGCILVVEDEAVIRETVQAQLEALGYDVILAPDGVEGLVAYQRHRSRIDAVILDLIMPRMNGEACFRALKKINPQIKVLVASGFVQRTEIRQLLDEGVQGFMQKPFRRIQLSKQLARILTPEYT